jgi:hypothetical protein
MCRVPHILIRKFALPRRIISFRWNTQIFSVLHSALVTLSICPRLPLRICLIGLAFSAMLCSAFSPDEKRICFYLFAEDTQLGYSKVDFYSK